MRRSIGMSYRRATTSKTARVLRLVRLSTSSSMSCIIWCCNAAIPTLKA